MVERARSIDRSIDDALEAGVSFLRWWRRELCGLLPGKIGPRFAGRGESTLELTPAVLEGGPQEGIFPAIGIVPETDLLRMRKQFPKAATKNLNEVIALQIEQLVPLPATEVHFAFRICAPEKGSAHVDVEIVIVERTRLNELTSWIESACGSIEQLVAKSADIDGGPITLWKSESLSKKRNARRMNVLLIGLLVVLVGGASSALSARWERVEADWDERVRVEQVLAAETRALHIRVESLDTNAIARAGLRSGEDVRRMLAILTEALPDEVWSRKLVLDGDNFTMEVGGVDLKDIQNTLQADDRLIDLKVGEAISRDQQPWITVHGSVKR